MENLLKYPPSAIVDRPLPKKAFYEHLGMSAGMRRSFIDDIASLTWLYKLAPNTVNVAAGKRVEEIEVFAAELKDNNGNDSVFTFIDAAMPRYIVFLQSYDGRRRLLLNYKEPTTDKARPFSIIRTFSTAWTVGDLCLPIAGNSLDEVWEYFAGNISGYGTATAQDTRAIISLEEQVRQKVRAAEALQNRVRRERQFNRQVELNSEARRMKQEIALLQKQISKIKLKSNQ